MLRERLPEIVFLLIVCGLVAGFVLGRRKGKARLQAALSLSRAEGHAEASTALAAQLSNVVNVTAGNTGLPSAFSPDEEEAVRSLLRHLAMGLDRDIERAEQAAAIGATGNHDYGAVFRHVEQLHVSGSVEPRCLSLAERDRGVVDRDADPSSLARG